MEEMPTAEEVDEMIAYLIDAGAMELVGMSESGEPCYRFTPECQNIAPELYEMAEQEFGSQVMALWQNGMVDLIWPETENEDLLVTLLPPAFDEELVNALTADERHTLYEIIRHFDEHIKNLAEGNNNE